jgi:biotin transport system ATP-binding protein
MTELLKAENLCHSFPAGHKALKNVSLTVYKGDFILLAGECGSGKTVLMKHFNGLLAPSSGAVLYRGKNIQTDLKHIRQKVGLVFQNSDTQILGQTVFEDVCFGPENMGFDFKEVKNRAESAIASVGLEGMENERPWTLSGGEKKKLAIAGVLAMQPEVIILDEPFNGLDMKGVRMVLEQLIKLEAAGTTVILISHDIEKAAAHANRLVIMKEGEIVLDGNPAADLHQLEQYGILNPMGRFLSLEKLTWLS